jgi:hypothetical protein
MIKQEVSLARLKKKILDLKPFLPGSLSVQWNVCGTPGCRCRDKVKPRRHGPYYQLSFTVKGKSSTMFIRKQDLAEVRKRIRRYQQFKKLTQDVVQASVDLARKQGFSGGEHEIP